MEVLKYERTKATQLITLPNIATSLKPYRFARADTKGPEKVNSISLIRRRTWILDLRMSDQLETNHVRYILIIDSILIDFISQLLIVGAYIDCLTIRVPAQTSSSLLITDDL